MQKLIEILILFTTISCIPDSPEIKIIHYNIKELDSLKINNGIKDKQIFEVKNILSKHQFDILSLNEIQYDIPMVPTSNFFTRGQNLQKLKQSLGLKYLVSESFNIANTGLKAKKRTDGSYYLKPNTAEARSHADQINFGTVPGQYSSGALFKYKKIKEIVFNDLKWKDFDPKIDLSKFKTSDGNRLPKDIQLFDKNFTDVILDVEGKKLHLILLHTVPSYHFGNPHSVNYIRNEAQLKFLEWYLTGSTDINVDLPQITPLKENTYYIATGDWNTDYNNAENPGSKVLRRLFNKSKLWIGSPDKLTFTNESDGYNKTPFRLMLDYMVHSNNIETLEGKIIHPDFTRVELGCKNGSIPDAPQDFVIESYTNGNKTCKVFVHKTYRAFKNASDHYPIWGHFKLK